MTLPFRLILHWIRVMDKVPVSEYRQWILTFRLKYVFVAGKIIRTARQIILKLLEGYPYKEVFQ